MQAACCHGGIDRYLIVGLITMGKAQIIIFGIEVNEGEQKLFFDLLPEDAGHFVAVHFDNRVHGNLIHNILLSSVRPRNS